jgi:hypothetical protein
MGGWRGLTTAEQDAERTRLAQAHHEGRCGHFCPWSHESGHTLDVVATTQGDKK